MRNLSILISFVSCFVLNGLPAVANAVSLHKDTYTVKTVTFVGDFLCPYICKTTKTDEYSGFYFDIMSEAFKAEGVNLKLRPMPWRRGIRLAQESLANNTSKVDGVIATGGDHAGTFVLNKDFIVYDREILLVKNSQEFQ